MKNSTILRSLTAILSALALTVCMISCNDEKSPSPGSSGSVTSQVTQSDTDASDTTTRPLTDPNGFLIDDLPQDLHFGNADVNFLVWSDVENPEFDITEATGDTVNDAIYYRNLRVEERLGVNLVFDAVPGNYNNQKKFVSTAEARLMSGEPLDIMAAYSLTAAGLVAQNLTYKLNTLDYLDFDQPWWPERLVTESQIKGNIYLCSGDISTNMLHKMHAVFFDKTMCENYGYSADDLYTDALNGTWTLDDLFTMTCNIYEDLNNNDQKDKDDKYGLFICDNYFDAFFYSGGLRIVDRDADGTPKISDMYGSEKSIDLANRLGSFFADQRGAFFVTNFTEGIQMANGKAMMIVSRCDIASKRLRLADNLDYGVLPVPKYDEKQENYVSCLAFPCTLYAAAYSLDDPAMVGAVLEAMGSEGYRQITPALFETTMKLKYSSDDQASRVYDIIRESVTFDLGRIFHASLNNVSAIFRNACSQNTGSFASTSKANQAMLNKMLKNLIDKIN